MANGTFIDGEMKTLQVSNSDISGSHFDNTACKKTNFSNVDLSGTKIEDANLSNFEIDGAQIGGASFKNIGVPPEGHPLYQPIGQQKPVKFEACDLNGSQFSDSNLTNVDIVDCVTTGMKIDGILVTDLLENFHSKQGNDHQN